VKPNGYEQKPGTNVQTDEQTLDGIVPQMSVPALDERACCTGILRALIHVEEVSDVDGLSGRRGAKKWLWRRV
jgi:hypothetical protein